MKSINHINLVCPLSPHRPLYIFKIILFSNISLHFIVQTISKSLTEVEISHKIDDNSGSIGKRYARTDEVAIPYGICVDFDSLKQPHTATLRERDTMLQVRMPIEDIPIVLRALANDKMSWTEVQEKYPKFEQQETTK